MKQSIARQSVANSVGLILALLPVTACAGVPPVAVAADPVATAAPDGTSLKAMAESRIATLEKLMRAAEAKQLDITREQTLVWFSRTFLRFADWDEANKPAVEAAFGYFAPFAARKAQFAADLPDFERREVIAMLDRGIATLQDVVDGRIKRPPVRKVDWQNVTKGEEAFQSNGKPVFLYDYFSKSVGRPLTDKEVYNDHLGAIFHGGENLYPVDHDRAINSFLLREDGTFDPDLLREITSIPDTNVGFLLLWNSGIPDWVLKQDSEAATGRSLFTGFNIDSPLVRDVWGKIIRKSGELTRGKKVTRLGYILSNEPHWFSEAGHWTHRYKEMNGISSHTRNRFRSWLDARYAGRIDALNRNWGTSFAEFEAVDIEIPISRKLQGTPIWYDWNRFNMDRVTDWFTYLQGELRKTNPDADTHIKIMPNMFTENSRSHGIDLEALTELTSMIGDDAKAVAGPRPGGGGHEKWMDRYAYEWEETALSYDFMESVSPGKLHINSESHFLSTSNWRQLDTAPDYVHSVYWLATLHGMDANFGWFWARDPDGSPEDRLEGELDFFDPALAGSYAASVNMQPQIANAATQVMFDLNSVADDIVALRRQRRPLRLFYSEASAINKPNHMSQQFEIYESLYFEGMPLGFATAGILSKQDHRDWDAILVSHTEFATDADFAAVQAYLDGGGTVILHGPDNLTKTEYGVARNRRLTPGMPGRLIELPAQTDLTAVRAASLKAVEASRPEITVTEANGTPHKGAMWRAVRTGKGRYLVNILNLGKRDARINLSGTKANITGAADRMTGNPLPLSMTLRPNEVRLIDVQTR